MSYRRTLILPRRGRAMISTDLHGNGEDFRELRRRFLERVEHGEDLHWVLLGDLVHGPDERAREDQPELYDYPDESWEIVEGMIELRERWPQRVHLVLGNHDHGHVGGLRPGKFYEDEALHLESSLSEGQLEAMNALFRSALLLVLAPCGVALSHGSPDDSLHDPKQLDRISLDIERNSLEDNVTLHALLTAYGQRRDVTERMLVQLSRSVGFDLHLLIHGHDRDLDGWFVENGNQLCPVIFGALRGSKRYLELNLSARYRDPEDIREDRELLRLYPE